MTSPLDLGQSTSHYNPGGFPKIPSANAAPPPTPQGSLTAALFAQEHTIGNIITRLGNPMPPSTATPNFNPIPYIPMQLMDYADKYAGLTNEQQVDWVSDQLSKELRDKAIISANPWKSFVVGAVVNATDLPGYLLPGGAIYKNATRGLNIARSAMSVAGANAISIGLSESILQKTQYARTVDESILNTFSGALIGAAVGAGAGVFVSPKGAKAATTETTQIFANGRPTDVPQIQVKANGVSVPDAAPSPLNKAIAPVEAATSEVGMPRVGGKPAQPTTPPPLDYEYLKQTRSLVGIPKWLQKIAQTNPWMQLKLSPSGIARAVADELPESLIGTHATDIDLNAAPRNMEAMIKRSTASFIKPLADVQDIFLRQRGLEGNMLTRNYKRVESLVAGRELPGLDADTFYADVSQALRYPKLATNPDVIEAAKVLRDKVFNPLRDLAIELELLPKNVSVQTAEAYLTRIWNRAAVIERRADFEDVLYNYYTKVNDALRVTLPMVKSFEQATNKAARLLRANERMRADVEAHTASRTAEKSSLATYESDLVKADARIRQTNEVINNKKINLNRERDSLESDIKDLKQESQEFIASETVRLQKEIEFLADKKAKALRGAVQQATTPAFVERLVRRYDKDISNAQKELLNVTRKTERATTKEIASLNKKIQRASKETELELNKLKAELVEHKERKIEIGKQSQRASKNIESLNKKIDELESILKKQPDEILTEAIRLFNAEIEGLKYQNIEGQVAAHLLDSDGFWRNIQTPDELRANVTQTVQNILGLSDDRLTNPLLRELNGAGASPLLNRALLLPDNLAQPFTINDALTISESYIKSMAPVTEMTKWAKSRGYDTFNEARNSVKLMLRDEWMSASAGLAGKEAADLEAHLKKDLKNIDAVFDILMGVYGTAPNSDDTWVKFARNFRQYNQIRLMGSMTLSALPDIGTIAMRYGPYALMHETILPLLRSSELRSLSKETLQSIGFVCNTQLGLRMKTYADTASLSVARSRFGRMADTLMQGFGNVVLFNQWNDIAQEIAGVAAENFYLKNIIQYVKTGSIDELSLRRMARAGISKEDFKYIYEQWKTHGGMIDGCHYSNSQKWDISTSANATAYERYVEALQQEVRSTVIEPSIADKPLAMHTELGKTVFQFKSFGFAAQNKIFMSAIQNADDLNTISGLVTMLSLGALGYVATSLARGNEPDLSFQHLSKEAIDRSGILGMFAEYYNIANKLGIIPGEGTSRYRTRGIFGAIGGPTVGAIEDIGAVITRFAQKGERPLSTKDVDALLRLMPYQNLFYAHQLARAVANKGAVAVGFEDMRE